MSEDNSSSAQNSQQPLLGLDAEIHPIESSSVTRLNTPAADIDAELPALAEGSDSGSDPGSDSDTNHEYPIRHGGYNSYWYLYIRSELLRESSAVRRAIEDLD